MSVKTVQVNNVSLGAKEQEIKEFFSFSGEIEYLEMKGENELSQVAYITFKDPHSAETAVLLSGATIVDQSISITLAPEYTLPPTASVLPAPTGSTNAPAAGSAIQKAEDVVSSMLAKGFILGKDAVGKAAALDEKHKITSTTSATVASIDQKYGLSDKITTGATIMNHKVKEMDQMFQVSEKSKSAFAAAEQTVSNAGSAIMKNRYALTGVTWAAGALSRVTKAAGEVGQKTKEKLAEEERRTFAKAAQESNMKGHVQELAATSAKDDVQEHDAASAKGDVQELAAASAKSDVQEHAAASAKSDVQELAATCAKGNVQELAAASAKIDVQELAAASAKIDVQELAAASESDVQELAAACAKGDVQELAAACAKGDVQELAATCAKGDVQELAAACAKGDVQELAAASTNSDVQELAAASAKSDVQELAAASAKQEHPESQTEIKESTNPSLPPNA